MMNNNLGFRRLAERRVAWYQWLRLGQCLEPDLQRPAGECARGFIQLLLLPVLGKIGKECIDHILNTGNADPDELSRQSLS